MIRARTLATLLAGGLALLGVTADAAAEVYKWVDAEGRTHYSATPPPGTAAQPVEIRTAPPAPPSAPPAAGTPPAPPGGQPAGAGGGPRPPDASRAEACATARHNLELLEKDGPVAKAGPDGKNVLLEGEARSRELERARKAIAYLCEP